MKGNHPSILIGRTTANRPPTPTRPPLSRYTNITTAGRDHHGGGRFSSLYYTTDNWCPTTTN